MHDYGSNFAANRKAILSFNSQSINLHITIKCKYLEESCVENMEYMKPCQLLSATCMLDQTKNLFSLRLFSLNCEGRDGGHNCLLNTWHSVSKECHVSL